MNDIKNYIEKNLELENFNFENNVNYNDIKKYYDNAKADAIHCYQFIKDHLHKNKKILEVGGGVHLLTSFLNQEYDVTSVEPGGFMKLVKGIRDIEKSMGGYGPRKVLGSELEKRKTLRG